MTSLAISRAPVITAAGCYPDIDLDDYHGAVEICPGPSISSTGLKLLSRCPIKYFLTSPLSPSSTPRKSTKALDMGKAAADRLAFPDTWRDRYFIVPDGFSAAHTNKWADIIPEHKAAVEQGMVVLTEASAATVDAMAAAMARHELASALFAGGISEPTLAWQDKETGIWCRARPDYLPDARRFIPDYKSCASAFPADFAKQVHNYGYYRSAALITTGIEAIFGERPQAFLFIAQEKESPYLVQLFQLDEEARAWGESENRKALRLFADCLSSGKWPGYGADIEPVNLPHWQLKALAGFGCAGELEYPHR
jgi:hypothetical protein